MVGHGLFMSSGIVDGFVLKGFSNRTHIKYAAFIILLFCHPVVKRKELASLCDLLLKPILTPTFNYHVYNAETSDATCTPSRETGSAEPQESSIHLLSNGIHQSSSCATHVYNVGPSDATCTPLQGSRGESSIHLSSNDAVATSTPIATQTPLRTQTVSDRTFSSTGTQTSKARRMLTAELEEVHGNSISTSKLLDSQEEKRSRKESGRRYISRSLVERVKEQERIFSYMAKFVHNGGKKDFLAGMAYSSSHASINSEENWDGKLTAQDIINLAKDVHCPKQKKSVYDILTMDLAAQINHMSGTETLTLQDYASQKETFRALRRKLPGFFDSERQTENLKKKWHNEFNVILQPTRTRTGWRINPQRLHECLSFVYPWLKDVESEWWRLYGDARTFGGQKTVLIAFSNINNEALFNGCDFQSPDEYWPIHIFYGSDSRIQLELNLKGSSEDSGYLNEWCDIMFQKAHSIFVAADAMFTDAILGGGLDPKSTDSFNMYNFETIETRSEVGKQSGLRSEVGREIEREHPESLLPSIPTANYIPCANHMFTRITEHLLTLRILSCMENDAAKKDGRSLEHFLGNINARGVRNGNFSVKFDGPKLEPITLNVTHAETISAPPEAFESKFPDILENVASKEPFASKLPPQLQKAMDWPTSIISESDLERKIWQINWEMHILCRKDPDPRKEPNRLHPGADKGSSHARDYRFGLLETEIDNYVKLADLFHGLLLLRYGSTRLYPYVMKRVDVVPALLRQLPFHSLFRGSTEGGEHCHYLHQCVYYSHSARGGGWKKEDPILSVYKWTYRRMRERIAQASPEIQSEFESYVESKMKETPDYAQGSTDDIDCQPLATLRRGNQVYFREDQDENAPKKGMVIDLTPRKQHLKIATSSKDRPALVSVDNICESPMLPLKGMTFLISGNLAERGDKDKMNTDKLTVLIKKNGGAVFTGNIESAKDAKFIVVTAQKEIDKVEKKLNKVISMAYRLRWPIISKKYILDVHLDKASRPLDSYALDLTRIENSSSMSLAHARISTEPARLDNISTISAHRELKRKIRGKVSNQEKAKDLPPEKT